MLSQNLKEGSSYASDMLILVSWEENWPRPEDSSGPNQDYWTA